MKKKIPLELGRKTACMLFEELKPSCMRIEVAGSIRRLCPEVGDIEIVCISREMEAGLFGWYKLNMLMEKLSELVARKIIFPIKGGEKFRQYQIATDYAGTPDGLCLDLFIVTPKSWGQQLCIRTGPADFSKACVTPVEHGGRLRNGLVVKDGRIWDSNHPLPTPEERDFMSYCGGWIVPERRGT